MTEETEQQATNWVRSLKREDLDLALDELELDKQGSYFKKCNKLHDWLLGNYTAEDFVQSIYENEAEARAHREGLRSSFVENTLHEKTGSTLFDADVDNQDTSIQMEIVNCVKAIERKVDTVQDKSSQLYYQLHDIIKQQQADLKQVQAEIRELMKMGKPSNPASSTRIESVDPTTLNDTRELSGAPQGNLGSRVNFQDTYDFRTYNSSSPVGAGECHSQQLRNEEFVSQLDSMQIGDNRQNITNQTSVNQTHPSRYDVGNIVRRWNINYNGEDGQSIEQFFTRVEECRWLAGLSEKEILCSLSELLKGSAAIWYRNNRTKWHTWQEFTGAARTWYGMRNLQQRLKQDTMARTQGDEEPVRVYVAKLQALLQKLVPTPNIEEQVSIIRENMLPRLQRIIRKENIEDIETLLSRAVEAEMLLTKENNFRPPPPTDTMLLPELGYEPPSKQNVERLSIAAMDMHEENSTVGNTTKIMELINEISEKIEEFTTQVGTEVAKTSKYKQYRRRKKKVNGKERTKDNTQQGTTEGQEKPKFRCYHCREVGHKKKVCPKRQDLQRDGIAEVNPNPKVLQQTSTTSSEGKCARSAVEAEQAHKVRRSKRDGEKEDVTDVDSEARWWLQVSINKTRIRALYDSGSSRTVMGQRGLQLASACGKELIPCEGQSATLANGSNATIVGYVWLPFEVAGIKHELKVAIMPELDADCFVGANFIRRFKTVHDPCDNKLFIKGTKKFVDLEVISVKQTNVSTIASIGLENIEPDKQREVFTGLLNKNLADEKDSNGNRKSPIAVQHLRKVGRDSSTEPEEEEPQQSTSGIRDQEDAIPDASERQPANSGLPGDNLVSVGKTKKRGRPRKNAIAVNRETAKPANELEMVSEAPGKRKPGRPKGSIKSVPKVRVENPSPRRTRAKAGPSGPKCTPAPSSTGGSGAGKRIIPHPLSLPSRARCPSSSSCFTRVRNVWGRDVTS